MSITEALQKCREQSEQLKSIYTPEFMRLQNTADKCRFEQLLQEDSLFVCDEISDQLKELIKSRNPSQTIADYNPLIQKHIGDCPIHEYGVWVFYPWSRRLVHILDEAEFIDLRTSANRHKITTAERDILATKKVGVIGLSVGQSVSVTMAMERGCGELRLADFDTLELNNLNRIRTGVHNLGVYKVYSVAREIAEIDPFFKVVCYKEGLTDDNIDDFFTAGGKLDAVIDECDSVNVKIQCRIKAKELQIPILMEASDRGTLDVERFDLQPDRPIMHGWLEHLNIDMDVLRNLKTNDEKVPYMLPISGLDTLSPRMKASMLEMRLSITTWPQLATAVTLGGAITADTCRRMFLGLFTDSGRYFIDTETLIPDTRKKNEFVPPVVEPLSPVEINRVAGMLTAAKGEEPIEDSIVKELVTAACQAPSKGNSQPWRWYWNGNRLCLFAEHRNISAGTDGDGIAMYCALGAALENIEIAARARGLEADMQMFPLTGERQLVAAITFRRVSGKKDEQSVQLAALIPQRHTNRSMGTGGAVEESGLTQLAETVKTSDGLNLTFISGREQLQQAASILGPAERFKYFCTDSYHEFIHREVLWDDRTSNHGGTGIPMHALGLSTPEEIGLKMVRDPRAIQLLEEWHAGHALQYTVRKALATAAAVGLMTARSAEPMQLLRAGRSVQRMWLEATRIGLGVYPVIMPLLLFRKVAKGDTAYMPGNAAEELRTLAEKANELFGIKADDLTVFCFILSKINQPGVTTPRKLLEQTLMFGS